MSSRRWARASSCRMWGPAWVARCRGSRSGRSRGSRSACWRASFAASTQALSPVVFLTYPVPKIVFLPIFMLWFGIGDVSKVFVIALACFYPSFINAYYGARATPTIMVWSGLNMGAGWWQIFRNVVVPSALPLVLAGLRVSLALSYILLFAAEMMNARSGLGFLIRQSEAGLRFDLMYVAIVAVAVRLRERPARAPGAPPRARVAGGHEGMSDRTRAALAVAAAARRLVLIGTILLAWEIAARSGAFSPLLVPSLAKIGREFWLLALRPESLMEAWHSIYRALGGFGLAAVVGIAIGVLMGRSTMAAGFFSPLLSGTYPIPKIALFPIFIYVFGIGSLSKVFLVFLECLYPIVVTTWAGTRAVDRVLLWSARNMGASRTRTLTSVVVPASAPHIFAGLRIALPIAMIVVIITEMISSADGLGYIVIYALSSFKTDRMLAAVAAIALLGLGLDRLLVLVRDRLVFWERLESYYARDPGDGP